MEIFSQLIILDLNKDEVVILNQEDDLITNAYVVSVADLRGKNKKEENFIPTKAGNSMLMFEWYTNFVFAIFSETSPLFKIIHEVI